ncbi:nucleoplasmin-like protein ANO39 [Symsagittifera roscoffensis]|uniref:nucleoplasmin-like protein ANO39 n=1 Tax=Symsagittifera roscoffensis TaxID=84072 RepID=UPI00307B6062
MEGLQYLLVEPACEVNEKGTREKNDGNEDLSLDDNEKIEADSEAESFVEEDWNDPEQDEVPKWTEPELPISAGTRSGNRKRTGMRKKKVEFKEEAERLGLEQESGEWPTVEEDAEEEKLSGECEEWDEGSQKSSDDPDSLCMILAEEKMRHRDRELQTDPSSGTYNLDQQEVRGGEELEKIAVSRKPFRELSCNSNVRTNLVPEDDMKVIRRIVCVKLKDDIHNPGEMNGQIIALKEHVKARYRLSDLIRVQKIDKMTSNLSTWIRTGSKEKGT